MRPGHFYPGDGRLTRTTPDAGLCFNEAGAFLPRRFRSRRRGAGKGKCFNEAGAFLPRRSVSVHSGPDGRVRASMRPGHFYPGDVAQFAFSDSHGDVLQ